MKGLLNSGKLWDLIKTLKNGKITRPGNVPFPTCLETNVFWGVIFIQ